ncbi:hypothetical protein [Brasilonema sp. UFV-L1]|uniref:hypothetical protein n=1 Tax=Brasilonema sp. UFV-L1 TaxID=2234130 RepID=UPI0030D9D940
MLVFKYLAVRLFDPYESTQFVSKLGCHLSRALPTPECNPKQYAKQYAICAPRNSEAIAQKKQCAPRDCASLAG